MDIITSIIIGVIILGIIVFIIKAVFLSTRIQKVCDYLLAKISLKEYKYLKYTDDELYLKKIPLTDTACLYNSKEVRQYLDHMHNIYFVYKINIEKIQLKIRNIYSKQLYINDQEYLLGNDFKEKLFCLHSLFHTLDIAQSQFDRVKKDCEKELEKLVQKYEQK